MKTARAVSRLLHLLAVVMLGVLFAGLLTLARPLLGRHGLPARQQLMRFFMARLTGALPLQMVVYGERPRTPALWIANHVSWMDIALLGRLAPLAFLSKQEVAQWPVAGWLAREAGTLFMSRGSNQSAQLNQQIADRLRAGFAVLLFPEGTTHDGHQVGRFHGRLMGAAQEAGSLVQPVAIGYRRDGKVDPLAPFLGDDDLLAHVKRWLWCEPAQVQVHLLEPIPSQGLTRLQITARCREAIQAALYGPDSPVAAPAMDALANASTSG